MAELLAARGELADEVAEGTVVGLPTGGGAQGADDVARDRVPVGIQVASRLAQDVCPLPLLVGPNP
jgi:hypothetical protein